LEQKEQAVKAAEARRQRARIAINPNQAPVTMAASRIAQEQSKGAASLATLHQQKAAFLQRRLELQTQIDRHQKDQQQLAVDLQKTIITAPATGTLLKLQVRNPGQTLHVGEAIGQISPSQAPLIVKARIAVHD
jgi:multidrug efflux pump subunit AcrA (membrane-fusion protein)